MSYLSSCNTGAKTKKPTYVLNKFKNCIITVKSDVTATRHATYLKNKKGDISEKLKKLNIKCYSERDNLGRLELNVFRSKGEKST